MQNEGAGRPVLKATEEVRQRCRPASGSWRRLNETAAALAVCGFFGCATLDSAAHLPEGSRAEVVSVSSGINASLSLEKVLVGDKNFLRATAKVTVDGQSLEDYEKQHGKQSLRFCWFMYQDLGEKDASGNTIYYLLNPRYQQSNQPRYIGAVVTTLGRDDMPAYITGSMVSPVRSTGEDPSKSSGWNILSSYGSRRDVLYFLKRRGLAPEMDPEFMVRLDSLCSITPTPIQAVVEYAPTTPVLLILSGKMR